MDKKLRETTNLCVEIMNSATSNGETWLRGTNWRLPFNVRKRCLTSLIALVNSSSNCSSLLITLNARFFDRMNYH